MCVCVCSVMSNSSRQAPLSVGFSRQEYWSELPFPPRDPPDPWIKPMTLCLLHRQADSLPLYHLGSPIKHS